MVASYDDAAAAPAGGDNDGLILGLGLAALAAGAVWLISNQNQQTPGLGGTSPYGTIQIPNVAGQTPQEAANTLTSQTGLLAAAAAAANQAAQNAAATGSYPTASQTPGIEYVAAAGDSIWTVAQAFCGDVSYYIMLWYDNYPAISAYNPQAVSTGQLAAGTPIFIRQPCVNPSNVPGTVSAQPTASGAVSYVVQPGDSLTGIAQQQCGDPAAWTCIYIQNQAVIGGNPNAIAPGMTFQITCDSNCPQLGTQPTGSGGGNTLPSLGACSGFNYATSGGETFAGLAVQYYSDPTLVGQIIDANPSIALYGSGLLPAGLTVCIPSISNITGNAGSGYTNNPCPNNADLWVQTGDGDTYATLLYYGRVIDTMIPPAGTQLDPNVVAPPVGTTVCFGASLVGSPNASAASPTDCPAGTNWVPDLSMCFQTFALPNSNTGIVGDGWEVVVPLLGALGGGYYAAGDYSGYGAGGNFDQWERRSSGWVR